MKKPIILFLALALYSSSGTGLFAERGKSDVRESFNRLIVKSEAPIPSEIANDAQAHMLAKEAAVDWGKSQLLTYILRKKARSGKTLAVAEIPSLELQAELRDYVKKARPQDVVYTRQTCRLTLVLPKGQLKSILKKN